MRMWALAAAALLSSLVLAGCNDDAGDGNGDGDGDAASLSSSPLVSASSSSSTSRSSSSSSGSVAPAPNHPPAGSIAASSASGAPPLAVDFTLSGSDPDGDAVAWDLQFGDGGSEDGTTLPATVSHTFAAAGNHTVEFTLSDGVAETSYNLTIAVASSGAAGLTFAGSVAAWCVQCTLFIEATLDSPQQPPVTPIPSVSWNSGTQGTDSIWVEIPASLVGRSFVATSSGADVGAAMLSACDPTAAAAIELFDSAATPEAGVIPAGTGCILLWDFPAVPPAGPPAGANLTLVVS